MPIPTGDRPLDLLAAQLAGDQFESDPTVDELTSDRRSTTTSC